jgi:hypothetical protein
MSGGGDVSNNTTVNNTLIN